MNAVERVRGKFVTSGYGSEFDRGYLHALDDVQKELDKEISCDYNAEIKSLEDRYKCEIAELEEKNKREVESLKQLLLKVEQERDEYKNKYEVVELIFGGK